MKLKNYFLGSVCGYMMLMCVACDDAGSKSAKSFAERFAGFVNEDQRDSIIAVYPAAEYAEEFELNYKPEDLKISKTETEGEYQIEYGEDVTLIAEVDKNGIVKVIKSNGLFKYPESKLSFAKKTGALKSNMTDEKLAKTMIQVENMMTELFGEFVDSRKNAIKNLGFTVTYEPQFGMDAGKGYYTLKNTTDEPIGGDEYELTYKGWEYYSGMEKERIWTDIVPGKDIEPNGSIRLTEDFTWHHSRELQAITMHTPSLESFFKHYRPTGEEYANYIKVHGDEVVKKDALSYGPYTLAGKLGGKYAIHINIEKGMKRGKYYYDKNGPKATLDLSVKSFNKRTGELIMEETNDKGVVTGTFIGTLTPTNYAGKMTSFQGKTYEFDLKVTD